MCFGDGGWLTMAVRLPITLFTFVHLGVLQGWSAPYVDTLYIYLGRWRYTVHIYVGILVHFNHVLTT